MCLTRFRSACRRPHCALSAIGALLVCALLAASAVGSERPPYSFAQVVNAQFDRWDRNHDGRLSAAEVDRLVQTHSVVGPEAAAVAAIHRYLRDKKGRSLSEGQLLRRYPQHGQRNRHDSQPRFASDYASFYWHLEKASRRLFGDADGPCLGDMKQGKLGDCYFVASLGVAVLRNPDAVRRMLRPRRDGSTDVFFAGRRPVNVPPLTDAEIALSSTTGDQGLWLNILEKAFSRISFAESTKKRHRWDIDLDAISRGGSAGDAISLITGHAAKNVYIRQHKGKGRAPSRRRLPALRRRFDNLLSRSISAGALTCAATPKSGRLPQKIANHHVFAILGYDRQRRIVHLWNPWANNFEPQGRPGLRNGYPTHNGRFQMPLDHFLRVFRCAIVESGQRAHS